VLDSNIVWGAKMGSTCCQDGVEWQRGSIFQCLPGEYKMIGTRMMWWVFVATAGIAIVVIGHYSPDLQMQQN